MKYYTVEEIVKIIKGMAYGRITLFLDNYKVWKCEKTESLKPEEKEDVR